MSSAKPNVKKQKPNPTATAAKAATKKAAPAQVKLTSNNTTSDLFSIDFSDNEDTTTNPDENILVSLGKDDDDGLLAQMQEQFDLIKQQHKQDEVEVLSNIQKSQQKHTKQQQQQQQAVKRKNPPTDTTTTAPQDTAAATPTTTDTTEMTTDAGGALDAALFSSNITSMLDTFNQTTAQDDDEDEDEIPLPVVDPKAFFNPFFEAYRLWVEQAPADIHRIFDPNLNDNRRKQLMDHLPISSQRQYAWAIPTDEVIKIMYHYGPVIEIGAGKGYWGYLLRKYANVLGESCKMEQPDDIYLGFDCTPSPTQDENLKMLNLEYQTKMAERKRNGEGAAKKKPQGKKGGKAAEPMRYVEDKKYPSWTHIDIGDSTELSRPENKHRTLFLCYPDDFEYSERSLAYDCFKKYKGEYIITVGEFLGETRQENPFGRSADGEFQTHLCDQFHKILHITLPSWPSSHDSFCVWKRTTKIAIDASENDPGIIFRYVPQEDKLDVRQFAGCCQDLLESLKASPVLSQNTTIPTAGSQAKADPLYDAINHMGDGDEEQAPALVGGDDEKKGEKEVVTTSLKKKPTTPKTSTQQPTKKQLQTSAPQKKKITTKKWNLEREFFI